MDKPTTASHMQCLCGAVYESSSLLKSPTLPIESEICHCSPCRHSSGALCPVFLPLAGPPTSLDACTYHIHPSGRVKRYLCSTCGSRTFDYTIDTRNWFACSGIIEPSSEARNVVRVGVHKHVADTVDGGLALLMPKLRDRDIPCYSESIHSPNMTMSEINNLKNVLPGPREDRLYASCHCKSVQFYILPPAAAGDAIEKSEVSRWLRDDKKKYLALNCACRYCRRAFGFSFASSAYVMPENIVAPGSGQSLFDYTSLDDQIPDSETSTNKLRSLLPALKFDFTSPGIRRSWCGICGASIFFERMSRPQCVNVSVGILRARSGSLARDWIDFDWEVWWRAQAVDKDMVDALEAHRTE